MKAKLIYHVKEYFVDNSFREIKIWKVPRSKDKPWGIKYSFAYIAQGERVVGYDNSEQKGDHRHFKGKEVPYKFLSLEKLWKDFKKDIDQFREEYHESQKHKNGH